MPKPKPNPDPNLADEGCPCGAQRGGGDRLPPPELQALAEQPGEAEAEAEAQALEGEGWGLGLGVRG